MGDRYYAQDSPRGISDEKFNKMVSDVSKGISSFNQLTRSISQKMSLFHTPQDSRANHQQLKELTEKGNKLATKINRRLQDMNKACKGQNTGPEARSRRTQLKKISSDFKIQVTNFEETCSKLMEMEQQSVDFIRRSSTSFRVEDAPAKGIDFSNYNEDQLYAQANITTYNEDDLARREEDILHINHQLREVNAAFREIDGLVQDQEEQVIEIVDNTQEAKENVSAGLREVKQADASTKYCACSKWKMIMYGGMSLIILILLLTLVTAFT